jgi:hypothetical protein
MALGFGFQRGVRQRKLAAAQQAQQSQQAFQGLGTQMGGGKGAIGNLQVPTQAGDMPMQEGLSSTATRRRRLSSMMVGGGGMGGMFGGLK